MIASQTWVAVTSSWYFAVADADRGRYGKAAVSLQVVRLFQWCHHQPSPDPAKTDFGSPTPLELENRGRVGLQPEGHPAVFSRLLQKKTGVSPEGARTTEAATASRNQAQPACGGTPNSSPARSTMLGRTTRSHRASAATTTAGTRDSLAFQEGPRPWSWRSARRTPACPAGSVGKAQPLK